MTKLLISTAFAGLLAFAGPAWAQRDNQERGERGRPARSEAAPKAAPAPQAAPAPPAGPANAPRNGGFMNFGNAARGAAPAAAPAARGSDENRQGRAMNNNAPPSAAMRGPSPNNNNNDRRGADNDRRDNNRSGFNNDRRPESRRDFSAYHRNFSAPRRYRAPVYQRPRGWYAHRWTFGEILPAMFWAQNYWLTDFQIYDLPPPPPGTVWVRDGDDALLIDRYSGEIIQVAYSVFY